MNFTVVIINQSRLANLIFNFRFIIFINFLWRVGIEVSLTHTFWSELVAWNSLLFSSIPDFIDFMMEMTVLWRKCFSWVVAYHIFESYDKSWQRNLHKYPDVSYQKYCPHMNWNRWDNFKNFQTEKLRILRILVKRSKRSETNSKY